MFDEIDKHLAETGSEQAQSSSGTPPPKKVKDLHKQVDMPKRETPPWPSLKDMTILAFDTEYQAYSDGSGNEVLCYTFSISHHGKSVDGYIDVKNGKRLKFDKFIGKCIEHAIKNGVLSTYPSHLYITAHFLKADIFNFKEAFNEVGAYLSSMRQTVVSLDKYYGVDTEKAFGKRIDAVPLKINTSSRNRKHIFCKFYDTMLLAPAGKSLSAVGQIVNLEKLEIPEDYNIEKMSEYKQKDIDGFKAYAIRDAIIARLYLETMIQFCLDNDLRSLPLSVGAIAVKLFKKWSPEKTDFNKLFGYEVKTHTDWNPEKGALRTVKKRMIEKSRDLYEQVGINGYHGGRNEAFWMGVTPVEELYDLDLPSCYTACMVGVREIDYDQASQVHQLDKLIGDVCSIGVVNFKFPDNTPYPCLPVRIDSGLVFPLMGESICTGHEIEAAINLGAEITLIKGFLFPWKNDTRIFEPFVKTVRDNRNRYKKGDFEEQLNKEIGNSLYGKIAQGLRDKNGFHVQSGLSKALPYTALTNPHYSAYTTGLARAVLGEILASIPSQYKVISVTTDGFITTAPLSEIPLNGPLCQRFRDLYHRISTPDSDGSLGEILELKHGAQQLICMKTRGQITLLPSKVEGRSGILAKAGVRPPKSESDHNAYMINLYKGRTPESKVDASHLTSTRDIYLERRDMVTEHKEQRLNMEFDFKRMPVDAVNYTIESGSIEGAWEHVGCSTVPFKTVDDIDYARSIFKGYRQTHCLKTTNDMDLFQDYYAMQIAKRDQPKLRIQAGESSDNLFIRIFIRHYMNSSLGLDATEMNATELSCWLESIGYPIKASTIRSAKRAALLDKCIPRTTLANRSLALILARFPNANLDSLFI